MTETYQPLDKHTAYMAILNDNDAAGQQFDRAMDAQEARLALEAELHHLLDDLEGCDQPDAMGITIRARIREQIAEVKAELAAEQAESNRCTDCFVEFGRITAHSPDDEDFCPFDEPDSRDR